MGVDQLLPFEENEETYECLKNIVDDIDEKNKQVEILKDQQSLEKEEFVADSKCKWLNLFKMQT